MLPSDAIVAAVATVAPPTMKKSPSAGQMKMLLPTSGGSNHKLPPQKKPMALPKATNVKDDMEKEQVNAPVTTAIDKGGDNGGGESGGGAVNTAVTTTAKEESSENAILPSSDDLKTFVEAWLARPENAQVSSTLLPTAKDKEEIIRGCGVDKKRLEGLFYRMRKKLKQKADGATAVAATGASDGLKAADGGSAANSSTVPASPQTAATAAAPAPTTTTGADATTTMTQQELENIAASRAFNEAIQSGSPFKAATEEAAAAAAAARANQNVAAAAPVALKSALAEEAPVVANADNTNLPAPSSPHVVAAASTDNISPEKQEQSDLS